MMAEQWAAMKDVYLVDLTVAGMVEWTAQSMAGVKDSLWDIELVEK